MSHMIRSLVSELGEGESQRMVNYYSVLMDMAVECPGFKDRAISWLQNLVNGPPPLISQSSVASRPPPLTLSSAASITPPPTPKPSSKPHPPTPNRPFSSKIRRTLSRRTLSRRKNL